MQPHSSPQFFWPKHEGPLHTQSVAHASVAVSGSPAAVSAPVPRARVKVRYARFESRLPMTMRADGVSGSLSLPIIGVIFSIWLITFLTPETWLRFAVWFVIGLVIYFAYSKRNSVMEKSER